MDKKHRGSHSELVACSWLLSEGYEVFRNVSQHGYADLIALKDGRTFFFDVKTYLVPEFRTRQKISASQIEKGVLPLHVTGVGECSIEWAPATVTARTCDQCGKSFKPVKALQRYCSRKCFSRAHALRRRASRVALNGVHS
jgi:hypothetical protein